MRECSKDCLSCSNSFSIAKEDSGKDFDELFCVIEQKIVKEDNCCEEYN